MTLYDLSLTFGINYDLFIGIAFVNSVFTLFLRCGADIGTFGDVLIAHPLQSLLYAPGMRTAVMMMIFGHNAGR